MKILLARTASLVGLALLGACSAVVTPATPDASTDASVPSDLVAPQDVPRADGSTACVFPNGARCEVGQVCPDPDGCNTCMCAAGGLLACTARACVDAGPPGCRLPGGALCPRGQRCPAGDGCNSCSCGADGSLACTEVACVDAGARRCMSDGDCSPGAEECVFEVGACGAPGRCSFQSDCANVALFCGCDGVSFRGCPNRPGRPARSAGACATDAGARVDVSCGGASIGPMGDYCAGPDDGPLPIECCTGWSCDGRRVLCNALPPTCAPGWVAAVANGCWGPCVPAANCAPMRCLGGAMCPSGWRCNDADTCELAPR